jgi:hypothetical protein
MNASNSSANTAQKPPINYAKKPGKREQSSANEPPGKDTDAGLIEETRLAIAAAKEMFQKESSEPFTA